MKKLLFLEYKFRDFTDQELLAPEPTGVMAAFEELNNARVEQIKRLDLVFGVSFVALPHDKCPLSPKSIDFARNKLKRILLMAPDTIWFDYLKFPGKWNVVGRDYEYKVHQGCKYCKGKDREEEINKITKDLTQMLPGNVESGVFTMPFRTGEKNWEKILGQDLKYLGNIFDLISPMLYHRMIDKKVDYIHEYVNYLHGLGVSSQTLPIIQLKDMPDDLPDRLSIDEIQEAVEQAAKSPSKGVAIFSWDQAIEKGKLEPVSKILRKL